MAKRRSLSGGNLWITVVVLLGLAAALIALLRIDTTGRKGSGLGRQYEYKLDELKQIDAHLFLYREDAGRTIDTDFKEPRAIAAGPEGKIYLAGDQQVQIYDNAGNKVKEINLNFSPRCLTVTDGGTIYLGSDDKIQVYNSDGSRLADWPIPGKDAILTSLAVAADNLFAADAGNRAILRYDTSGTLIKKIGLKDDSRNIPGFIVPSSYFDIAIAKDGLLRVADPGRHRIEAFTFDGDLELWWGKFSSDIAGFCGCCNPVHFALLPTGGFITCEKGLTRVKEYSPQGDFVGVVAGPQQFAQHDRICNETTADNTAWALDVACDEKGTVFILDPAARQVRIFLRKDNRPTDQ